MPMFDDPKEQLRRMQEELLAAEEEEEYDDLSDIDELLEEYLEEEEYGEYSEAAEENLAAYRNYSNNYGRSRAARFVDTDEYDDLDEDSYISREDYRKAKKKQSNRGLLIIICIELIAIACVLGWWASWLL